VLDLVAFVGVGGYVPSLMLKISASLACVHPGLPGWCDMCACLVGQQGAPRGVLGPGGGVLPEGGLAPAQQIIRGSVVLQLVVQLVVQLVPAGGTAGTSWWYSWYSPGARARW
jgi:hypothetical protein